MSFSKHLVDRMKHLLSTGEHADVHFLVGQGDGKKLLPAHKLILMQSSDVFERMFSFDAVNSNVGSAANPVVVSDVAAGTFKTMLSFIYTDDLSGLNGENAMELLYAAKKYNIALLAKACLDFPIFELQNVFVAYTQALILEEAFSRRILNYIGICAETLFESDAFLEIDQKLLCELLDSDQLETDGEMKILEAALRWADEKCRKNGTDCLAENRRAVLGPALYKIRFPLIPRKEFSTKIVRSGILTMEELLSVYQHFAHPNFCDASELYALQFSTQERISYRKEGTLQLEIEKLSEFAQKEVNSRQISKNVTFIGGIPWKIFAVVRKKEEKYLSLTNEEESTEKYLGIFLGCTPSKEDPNWSYQCSATLRVISQKKGVEDFTRKLEKNFIFNNKTNAFGCGTSFSNLMNLGKGFYDKNEDKVTVAFDVYDVVSRT